MRVVAGQTNDLEARHLASFLEPLELGNPTVRAIQVAITHIERAIPGIDVAFQRFKRGRAGCVDG